MDGFNNKYPYTDFHELNLDWFLEKFKEMMDAYTEFTEDMTSKFNTLDDTVREFTIFVTNYFDNLDVQQEINNKLDQMAADGTLSALIQPLFDEYKTEINRIVANQNSSINTQNSKITVLEGRMDEFASLPDGSTAGDAELHDIRIGANGVTYTSAGDAVRQQISNLDKVNSVELPLTITTDTKNGVTLTRVDDNTYTLSGEATGNAVFSFVNSYPVTPGERIIIITNTTNSRIGIFTKADGGSYGTGTYTKTTTEFVVPNGKDRILIRAEVVNGNEVDETVKLLVCNKNPNNSYYLNPEDEKYIIDHINGINFASAISDPGVTTDLNDIKTNGRYTMADNRTYLNIPTGFSLGFLDCMHDALLTLQILYQYNGGKVWKRRCLNTNWEDWVEIGAAEQFVNNYTFNEYSNSYEVTASPTITADTNNYLASSGNTTDRTSDIVTMLTQNGVCNLGPGDFYVSGVDMPDNTSIIGSGSKTRIILSGSGSGYAIKPGDFCQISKLKILGNTSAITPNATVGNRHGILWQGNYTETESSAAQPKMCIISDLYIENFAGGAITCYDTGLGTFNNIEATNLCIRNCDAGINISYYSEFHKFTNVRTQSCYYGCINNGGNNVFVNCDFSTCKLAFLMDNSQNHSPNNSHGSVIGCVFNHTDSNNGIGIKILNCNQGFIFTGCQIFYSQIDIEDSSGIVISNTNFGLTNTNITIKNGAAVLFANNMHQGSPTITVTNNSYVNFVNCYTRAGASVTP